ncbi:terminase large subunit, partial [Acinetobacter baumannii]
KPDAKDNIFPRKGAAGKKIDAMVGVINAAARARHWDNEEVFDLIPGDNSDDFDFDDYIQNMVVGRR